ncbi:flagellar basal body rod protein FlgC [Aureimonas sp. SA4125]|uniref:flagellar basal body rod protein FlgC n=1 Tax=Aureimonas sp. SA4125 TaxID=2826993 RepID=UPI001CC6762A|nr:flagellar basal body rod C-terminal domain-containing protein [Aureimonas sp. SA4125]BDA83596.1 flagellar basal body rod protein FlgC [Aureimonas sp. SA4125]
MNSMAISLSGMLASTARLDVAASNIANARTRGPVPETPASEPLAPARFGDRPQVYQAVEAVQRSVGTGMGASVIPVPTVPSYLEEYDPSSVYANAKGMVAAPNVSDLRETVGLVEAVHAYKMNLSAFRAADEMMESLFALAD